VLTRSQPASARRGIGLHVLSLGSANHRRGAQYGSGRAHRKVLGPGRCKSGVFSSVLVDQFVDLGLASASVDDSVYRADGDEDNSGEHRAGSGSRRSVPRRLRR
jgi:hypothetical protein